jgi:DinB family protein
MRPTPGVPCDRAARPSLDEALALRHQAMALVRGVLDTLTDDQLSTESPPLVGAGWPPEGTTYRVRECLSIVLNEEWYHREYAERDLAVIEGRT